MMSKMQKFINKVQHSDVVVFDDSHAVALSYKPGMDTPEVVAKGMKKKRELILALSLKETGGCGKEVFSHVAKRLHRTTKSGKKIPGVLYEPVAEILAAVYDAAKENSARDPHESPIGDLLLPEGIERSLRLAVGQYKSPEIFEKWGICKKFPYGNALTLLFSGASGAGKTETAKWIAKSLDKKLIFVNYSRLRNNSIDAMEKNIAGIFETARKRDEILFWDDADTFIYNRDELRSWEAHPLSSILYELEKFQGICIFSTNREATLDTALLRRISLKIDFSPPAGKALRELWTKMLPQEMPLAGDVDLDVLSQTPLTGGELKNVILNAARNAASNGADSAVGMADFMFGLDLEAQKKSGVANNSNLPAWDERAPLVKLENMALPADVAHSLDLALNQRRCRNVMEKWGIDKAFPYGNALTLLFYGPPGVGKTASAEAIAGELGKNIIVVDYGKLESKWLGETEKNIAAAFRKARERDCVLFWDEADSVLYSRDIAERSWEFRSINVMLQELEKFRGVCIFSTNREVALDGAFSRRISLKIEFKPPAPELVRELWAKMLPPAMPLADDVDFDVLSCHSLTGGDIKNVICNAARSAAGRGIDAVVTMADFKLAVDLETHGKDNHGKRIGFNRI